jgi:hypothetical protein
MIVIGASVSFLIGSVLSWRQLALAGKLYKYFVLFVALHALSVNNFGVRVLTVVVGFEL